MPLPVALIVPLLEYNIPYGVVGEAKYTRNESQLVPRGKRIVPAVDVNPSINTFKFKVIDEVNVVPLVPVPHGVVTTIFPFAFPEGTVAEIVVLFVTEKTAVIPLNVTDEAFVNSDPVIVTTVPAFPLAGVNDEMTGAVISVTGITLLIP